MSELSDLFQEIILDHYRRPRNSGTLPAFDRSARGDNPLCGDRLSVQLKLKDGRIEDIRFQGAGCAISVASASLMTESVKGRTLEEARDLFDRFHSMVLGQGPREGLGKLEAFAGVSAFPVRVKCATLAWHTLKAALDGKEDTVSTE